LRGNRPSSSCDVQRPSRPAAGMLTCRCSQSHLASSCTPRRDRGIKRLERAIDRPPGFVWEMSKKSRFWMRAGGAYPTVRPCRGATKKNSSPSAPRLWFVRGGERPRAASSPTVAELDCSQTVCGVSSDSGPHCGTCDVPRTCCTVARSYRHCQFMLPIMFAYLPFAYAHNG